MPSKHDKLREYRRQMAEECMARWQNTVLLMLRNAGFTVDLKPGWRGEWLHQWNELRHMTWSCFCRPIKYGQLDAQLELYRDDKDSNAFRCRVTLPTETWVNVWVICVSNTGIVTDKGFNLSKLLGMGPEEVPF